MIDSLKKFAYTQGKEVNHVNQNDTSKFPFVQG